MQNFIFAKKFFFLENFDYRGKFNLDHECTSECLWFCFNGILQSSLDEAKLYWNTHYIRPCHETVAGVPNILFDIPEQFGGFDFRVRVPADKLQEVQVRYSQENNENEFEDYFEYLMEFYELQPPSNYNEVVHVFNVLMRHAN